MPIAIATIELTIPSVHSLKDKRRVVKSIVARLHEHFNISAAEMEDMDVWQRAVIGMACISNSAAVVNREMDKAIDYLENGEGEYYIARVEFEMI